MTGSAAPRVAPVLYAAGAARGLRQLLGDLIALALAVLAYKTYDWVHTQVDRLSGPAKTLGDAGDGFERSLGDAGHQVGRLPGVGDDLAKPFDAAAGAGRQVSDAGQAFGNDIGKLAVTLGLLAAVVPVLIVLWWVARRMRWIREATAARRLVRGGADASLFALRALLNQPLPAIAGVARRLDIDPGEAWRRGDPEALAALAKLELNRLGLS
jgi:hypothetical protein